MKTIHFKLSVMKTRAFTNILLLSAMILPLGLSGQTQQEVREVPAFSGVSISGVIELTVTQGDAFNVTVEAEEGLLPDIETRVNKDILEISFKGRQRKAGDLKVYVTAPVFSSLEAKDAGSVKGTNTLSSPSVSLLGSGAASFNLDVDTELLTTVLSGASNVILRGRATKHMLSASGACMVKAYELDTEVSNIVATGASSVMASVQSSINIDAGGASNVSYRGEPLNREVKVTGMSNITAVDGDMTTDAKAETDTVVVRVGQREIRVVEGSNIKIKESKERRYRNFRDNWTGLELGINGYLSPDNKIELQEEAELLDLNYGKSIAVNLNLWQQNLVLIRGHLGFVTGLGVSWNNYRFNDKNVTLEKGPQELIIHDVSPYDYKKNKLTVSYLNVPLLLEFQTPGHNQASRFHLSGGINVGLRLGSHTKQMVFIDGEREKFKEHKDFYINPFRYDATARVGWGRINLFASYALNTLFRDGKGPELTPFTAGLRIVSF